MLTGHCESMPNDSTDEGNSKSCCVAFCLAIAVTPSVTREPQDLQQSTQTRSFNTFVVGLPAETATPPPKLS